MREKLKIVIGYGGSDCARAAERLQQLFPRWEISAESDWRSPASCILAKARLLLADLLVVGAEGHSALGKFFLGSVSFSVATRAHGSVEVIRLPARS
jgi:nucleotide-binding universal stress UspA family protein